ncbi:MAG: hypothetical protein GEU94_09465 [Micromonosporaceae bacterium]|nr:hypothetical protein [Micromonosporaceae bacterium]
MAVLLREPAWSPPGVDRDAWAHALAEDSVDLLAALADAEAEVAIAVAPGEAALAESVRWPAMPILAIEKPRPALAMVAAHERGFDQAAVLASDAPDLPAMLIGKLLQPLDRRGVAAAPADSGGLLGLAAALPAPGWLLRADPDLDADGLAELRAAAPSTGAVAATPGWHRLRDPESLARLDVNLEGWEATRALLGG